MKLRIRKRPQKEWLVLFALTMPFLFYLLIDMLHLPAAIKYLIDVTWLLLLILIVLGKSKLPNPQVKKVLLAVSLFAAMTLIGFILEYQSIIYYLWGARNNLRFFVFFIACVLFLSSKSVDSYFKFMDILFHINFVVSLFQFFILHVRQDYLGGIFGVEKGCNSDTNIFLLIMAAWHILQHLNGKENFRQCVIKCLMALLIAALAELKIFFVEFVILVALASLITKMSARKLWIVAAGAVGMMISLEIVNQLFPHFANWFNTKSILENLTSSAGYTHSNDMNRLTFFAISMDRFLDTWPRKMFGLGLGNCDYASGFDFLTTPFYAMNRNLHYTWFSSAFLLLETGIVGLGVYLWIFVQIYFGARQREKKGLADPTYCQMARIMAVMCPILVIYNSSLRTEAGYMVYFVLALPFLKKDGRGLGGAQHAVRKEALLDGKA